MSYPLHHPKSAGAVLALLLATLILCCASPLQARELTAAEARGKEIYFSGKSPSGQPILAYFGEELVEIAGEFATCGSCHGYDGLGRPESGVLPSNITWKYLVKSYGHVHPDGVEHPAFDVASLKDYMVNGTFPGGAHGDPSMPVYDITEQDLDDLIAYMKLVGELYEPGLSDEAIEIGTLLPGQGRLAPLGEAMRGILEAYFKQVNERGGIYGRRLALAAQSLTDAEEQAAQIRAGFERKEPFALVATFTPGADHVLQSIAAEKTLPLIGPFTLFLRNTYTQNRYCFALYPGLGDQLRALTVYAANDLKLEKRKVAVLHPADTTALPGALEAAEEACQAHSWEVVTTLPLPAGPFDMRTAIAGLKKAGINLVVFLGMEEQALTFLQAADAEKWHPTVLASGIFAGRAVADAPEGFAGRLFLAYPTLAKDRQEWGISELSRLMRENQLEPNHLQATISAYAAAKTLVEALRLAGRDLDRRKLVAVLEKFYQFETGLTPALTFSPNRRTGARGAWIVGQESEAGKQPEAPVEAVWVDLK
ncbi:ABC transporter substrate-binding protein [Desulfuromonas versatilis]|uniref:ABC transporter substrate-binding protein n=1 Tax=Desulfuromonas versatilis TaxID=2802975 RepID=A0ABN6DX25_9BACT|nr:ABC transporter substrate-binding protein [Desulfuromonas versatilis]BCR04424.1 ABC transporter substrate-binding protein [Desulfuromonas versatilis]